MATSFPSHWYATQPIDVVAAHFGVDMSRGLTTIQRAAKKKEAAHRNAIINSDLLGHILIRQLSSPLILLMFCAATVSFALGERVDAVIVATMVVASILLGSYQEWRAERNLLNLTRRHGAMVPLLCDGIYQSVYADELVPGDIIALRAGDTIPAQVRFFETHHLVVDQLMVNDNGQRAPKSSGALPTARDALSDARAMGTQGTRILHGSARAIVCCVAKVTTATSGVSHAAQVKTGILGDQVAQYTQGVVTLVAVAIMVALCVNLLTKADHIGFSSLLLFSCSLAITVIPQALPLVLTMALSHGAIRLLRRGIVVKDLASIEEVGGMQILCGNANHLLIKNEIQFTALHAIANARVLRVYAALAGGISSSASIDMALWNSLSAEEKREIAQFKILYEAYAAEHRGEIRRVVTYHTHYELIIRGESSTVLARCVPLESSALLPLNEWIGAEQKKGRIVLAVARKQLSSLKADHVSYYAQDMVHSEGLLLLGCLSFTPPMPTPVADDIEKIRTLGVSTILFSQKSDESCDILAQRACLTNYRCVIADDIGSSQELLPTTGCSIVATATLAQEHTLLRLLKEHARVGYVGKAPLDATTVAIVHVSFCSAEPSGSECTASDIVLGNDGLHGVIDAIRLGRETFINTIKYLKINLCSGLGNFCSMIIASLFMDALPMLPVQLLLLNILADVPLIALAADTVDPEELKRPIRVHMHQLIATGILFTSLSSLFDLAVIVAFGSTNMAVLRTNWFLTVMATQLALLLSLRSNRPFYRSVSPPPLLFSLIIGVLVIAFLLPFLPFGAVLFHFVPPQSGDLFIIGTITLTYFFSVEIMKTVYNSYRHIHKDCK